MIIPLVAIGMLITILVLISLGCEFHAEKNYPDYKSYCVDYRTKYVKWGYLVIGLLALIMGMVGGNRPAPVAPPPPRMADPFGGLMF